MQVHHACVTPTHSGASLGWLDGSSIMMDDGRDDRGANLCNTTNEPSVRTRQCCLCVAHRFATGSARSPDGHHRRVCLVTNQMRTWNCVILSIPDVYIHIYIHVHIRIPVIEVLHRNGHTCTYRPTCMNSRYRMLHRNGHLPVIGFLHTNIHKFK